MRSLFIIFFIFLCLVLADRLVYAEHKCSRTVSCSDGVELIDTQCYSSYDIINGHIVDNDADDSVNDVTANDASNSDDINPVWHTHRHHHHPVDPCTAAGHGSVVDDGLNSPSNAAATNSAVTTNSSSDGPSDDPYGLRHGRSTSYDPNDPYGLKQKTSNQTVSE